MTDLQKCSKAPDILREIAQTTWGNQHPGEHCPKSAIPAPQHLCKWMRECPDDLPTEARGQVEQRLSAIEDGLSIDPDKVLESLAFRQVIQSPTLIGEPKLFARMIEQVHQAWATQETARHPVAPLVQAWQNRPRPLREARATVISRFHDPNAAAPSTEDLENWLREEWLHKASKEAREKSDDLVSDLTLPAPALAGREADLFKAYDTALETLDGESARSISTGEVPIDRAREIYYMVVDHRVNAAEMSELRARWRLVMRDPIGEIEGGTSLRLLIEHLHRAYTSTPVCQRSSHPLSPLVKGWLERPVLADWDERRHTNLPGKFTNTSITRPDETAHLPADWLMANPDPDPAKPRFVVGYLPTLEPPESILPLNLLNLFGRAASPGRHGPVRVYARIGWEIMVAASAEGPNTLAMSIGRIHAAVFPKTAWRKREGERIVQELDYLDSMRLKWVGDAAGGIYPIVTVWRQPATPNPNDVAIVHSHMPPGGGQGPQVDRLLLRHLAATRWREHRAMIAAYTLIDRYGTTKGRLIAPTLPVVRRDAAGYILDAKGKIVTEKGAGGVRRPTKRATHPKAVHTGEREPNPEADRAYRWVEGDDLLLLANGYLADTPAGRRGQKHLALKTVRSIQEKGYVRVEEQTGKSQGGTGVVAVRFMPSEEHLAAHSSRWGARRLLAARDR